MNILLLSNKFLNNGKEATEITVNSLATQLEQKGHAVYVIPEKSILKTIQRARKIKKEKKISFDIIHGFSAAPMLASKVLLTKLLVSRNAKTVHTLKSYSKHFLGSLHFSFLLRFIDTITVSTVSFQRALGNPNNCKVIRSSINTEKFIPLPKEELKEKYHFNSKKIIFYYGSFYRTKGVPELLRAARPILLEDQNTILVACPRHSVDQDIKELVEKLNLEEKIHFVTDDIKIVEYLNLADVLVLPYTNMIGTEGNPSCLLEGAACKIPIVTSDFPELREMFQPETEVLMAKPGDIQELQAKIRQTLQNPSLAKNRAEQAFKKISQFGVTKITSEFLKIYSS